MQKNNGILLEACGLLALFVLVTGISYSHVESSVSVVKYLFSHGISFLEKNYFLYQHSFKDFIFKTSAFHNGDSEAGWRTALYLLPLFVFCDSLGGLNLQTIYLFSITVSLFFLVLFYWWVRKNWGKVAALFAAFFLGFSSIFQEIARSGNYHAYSVFVALVWVFYCFSNLEVGNPLYFGGFGLLTGALGYVYGLCRLLIVVGLLRVWWSKPVSKRLAFGLFIGGLTLVLAPGIIILFELHKNYHGPVHLLFIDRENILDYQNWNIQNILKKIPSNLNVLVGRLTGRIQVMDSPMHWEVHAHFLNLLLVVPMFIGMARIWMLRKARVNQLLILIALMIYLTPVLTSGGGYREPRRALFYIIPMYCFIGIGCKEILEWVISFHRRSIKRMAMGILFICMSTVLVTEMLFIYQHIIFSTRDLGIFDFTKRIKQMGICGSIYYLQGYKIYNGASEKDIMSLALTEKGTSPFDMQGGWVKEALPPDLPVAFFVARGFGIPDEDFNAWMHYNDLRTVFLFESPLVNLPPEKEEIWVQGNSHIPIEPFRMYRAYRLGAS